MLEDSYQIYKDDVNFLFVYIREAHPSDSNWGVRDGVRDPRSQKERNTVAAKCTSAMGMSMPMVVDDMQDTVNMRYRAWPERIYLIGRDGRIAHKSGIGPFGFLPGLEAAVKELKRRLPDQSRQRKQPKKKSKSRRAIR